MLTSLTTKQLKAATSLAKNNLIIAGAGTGKTSTLLARLIYLLHNQQVSPEHILCLAFAKEAATEMHIRFQKEYPQEIHTPHISTFHSLALSIIKKVEKTQENSTQLTELEDEEKKRAFFEHHFLKLSKTHEYHVHIMDYFLNLPKYTKGPYWQTLQDTWADTADTFYPSNSSTNKTLRTPERIQYELFPMLWSLWKRLQTQNIFEQTTMPDVFHNLLKPLIQHYKNHLKITHCIDFQTMISKATHYVKTQQFQSTWAHILIDEYQDLSLDRYHLIKALKDQTNAALFCVGDDAQAIYEFAGSQIDLILNFKDYFGDYTCIELDQTFRFGARLCQISAHFIHQNPEQIRKTLRSGIKDPCFPIQFYPNHQPIAKLLHQISKQNSILMLARFNHQLPSLKEQAILQTIHSKIAFKSIHASKGQQADIVIIVGLNEGDFPSQKQDLLNINSTHHKGQYPYAEERRLFYVAITRAKQKVYLVEPQNNPSPFVNEIKQMMRQTYPLSYITHRIYHTLHF
ncbi:MAG: UvrD-helicase domain-containing protein [Gammaproteobacteria bacterium]|nr:UvrD-helicase domain-containing protein [Gammaproteobacteria bacterium]